MSYLKKGQCLKVFTLFCFSRTRYRYSTCVTCSYAVYSMSREKFVVFTKIFDYQVRFLRDCVVNNYKNLFYRVTVLLLVMTVR